MKKLSLSLFILIISFCFNTYSDDSQEQNLIKQIYNEGERLIPGETHDFGQLVCHKSSYEFFKKIIEADILANPSMLNKKIKILDVGCGTGHGSFMLSKIIGTEITAVDIQEESINYAKQNYAADNITYIQSDLDNFITKADEYDYIVSRHALEHIKDGINAILKFKYHKRLMVNVPFNEAEGNIYHLVNWITEKDFELYPNKEFLYEGLNGVTYDTRSDNNSSNSIRSSNNPPNSIICVSSSSDLKPVKKLFSYPIPAWKPEFLAKIGLNSKEQLDELQKALQADQQEIAKLKEELIVSEEEKSIFLKLYRKIKQKLGN